MILTSNFYNVMVDRITYETLYFSLFSQIEQRSSQNDVNSTKKIHYGPYANSMIGVLNRQ